jgi:predicted Zn-dependent peptidase
MNIKTTTLANGLRVILAPCEAESIAFGLFIASGSRHENAKTAGISHFIEHMLFKGTPTRRPIDITRAIEGRGGNFNACTSEESTCYYCHMSDEHLEEAVDIISDMYLNATIPEDEFVREKQVVIEEIKMYADEPDAVAMENLQRSLFPNIQLGAPVAGSEKSLAPMTRKNLLDYIKSHYLPGNTVAVVVGKFNCERALDIISDRLGRRRPRPTKDFKKGSSSPLAPVVGEVTVEKDVNQVQLAIGYRTPGITHKNKYAASVMNAILGRGMSSRLFQEVREKRGLSYDIASNMQMFQDAGMFVVTAGLDRSKTQLALKTIDAQLKRIREKKVPASELARTKEFLLGNFKLSQERIVSKLFFYGSTMLSFGRLITTREQIDAIRAVTAADVLETAQEFLNPANRSISWVVPRA